MTETDKKIQDLQLEIEMLKRALEDTKLKFKMATDTIKLLEQMVKADAEARDISDFEV